MQPVPGGCPQLITHWGGLWHRAGKALISNKPICRDEAASSVPACGVWAHVQHSHRVKGRGVTEAANPFSVSLAQGGGLWCGCWKEQECVLDRVCDVRDTCLGVAG